MARMNLVLEDEINNRLKDAVPRGIRSHFCRRALDIALQGIEEFGPGFIYLILEGDISLKPSSSNDQNLATSMKGAKDEKPRHSSKDQPDEL